MTNDPHQIPIETPAKMALADFLERLKAAEIEAPFLTVKLRLLDSMDGNRTRRVFQEE